jgi:hypothetical protein
MYHIDGSGPRREEHVFEEGCCQAGGGTDDLTNMTAHFL